MAAIVLLVLRRAGCANHMASGSGSSRRAGRQVSRRRPSRRVTLSRGGRLDHGTDERVLRWLTAGGVARPAGRRARGLPAGYGSPPTRSPTRSSAAAPGTGRGAGCPSSGTRSSCWAVSGTGSTLGGPVAVRIGKTELAEVGTGDEPRPVPADELGRPRAQRAADPPPAGASGSRRDAEVWLRRRAARCWRGQRRETAAGSRWARSPKAFLEQASA